jgi:putative flippase GtrA
LTDIEQFIKYVICGGLSALTHLILLWIGVELLALPKTLSSFIGFCVGSIINYSLQHRVVFKKSGGHDLFFKRYVLVTSIMQIVNITMFWGLVTYTSIQYILAQVLVIGLVFICNYIINSIYTFMNPSY